MGKAKQGEVFPIAAKPAPQVLCHGSSQGCFSLPAAAHTGIQPLLRLKPYGALVSEPLSVGSVPWGLELGATPWKLHHESFFFLPRVVVVC